MEEEGASICWKLHCSRGVVAPLFGWQCLRISEPGQTVGRGKASFYLLFGHQVFCNPVPTHSWITNYISQSNSKGFTNVNVFHQKTIDGKGPERLHGLPKATHQAVWLQSICYLRELREDSWGSFFRHHSECFSRQQ